MDNKNFFLSILISSDKPFLWQRLCKSLEQYKNAPVEVIFVGPNPPLFKLSKNCKFIKTEVKPSQCWEIASREAKGNFLLPLSDDVVFSKNFVKILFEHIEKNKKNKYIYCISLKKRYKRKKVISNEILYNLNKKDKNSPLLGIIVLFEAKMWRIIGGIDNRFVALEWDFDMQLRFQEMGYKLSLVKKCDVTEILTGKNHLTNFAGRDKKTLKSFWIKDKKYCKNRLVPIKEFKNKNILKFSQGNNELINNSISKKWK